MTACEKQYSYPLPRLRGRVTFPLLLSFELPFSTFTYRPLPAKLFGIGLLSKYVMLRLLGG